MCATVVHVPLGERAYDVRIDGGLIGRAGEEIFPFLQRPHAAVITEENVASVHLDTLMDGLAAANISVSTLKLPQ
ncbi:MAG: 3-dehydroquinate synthase, partial [Boseongicola sp.]